MHVYVLEYVLECSECTTAASYGIRTEYARPHRVRRKPRSSAVEHPQRKPAGVVPD